MQVLVFRPGQIGDMLVAVPALRALREAFPRAHLTLLCDRPGKSLEITDLLRGSGLVDAVESYPVDRSRKGRLLRPLRMLGLARSLRAQRYDLLAYLAPSLRSSREVARDLRFFRLAGIRRCVGADAFRELPRKSGGAPLPEMPREADLLLERLAASGLAVPKPGSGRPAIRIDPVDQAAVDCWRAGQSSDGGRVWLGVGPGSEMPAKRYPVDRYAQIVDDLIETFDVWPVVFGGAAERATGAELVTRWGRGFNAAGVLGLQTAAAALSRCRLYLGNDTGTMHLAVAAGVPCVALFSAREHPGLWYPYGAKHRVLRRATDCEGCLLKSCLEKAMECLLKIPAEEVRQACEEMLRERGVRAGRARTAEVKRDG